MKDKRRYRVLTWDPDLEKWTPQIGVRCGPYTLWGLRKPLRQLRELGYVGSYKEPCVLVEEIDNDSHKGNGQ